MGARRAILLTRSRLSARDEVETNTKAIFDVSTLEARRTMLLTRSRLSARDQVENRNKKSYL
jgi:hypothetical protein